MSKGQEQQAEDALKMLDIDLSYLTAVKIKQKEQEARGDRSVLSQIKDSANFLPFLSGAFLMTFFQVKLNFSITKPILKRPVV